MILMVGFLLMFSGLFAIKGYMLAFCITFVVATIPAGIKLIDVGFNWLSGLAKTLEDS